MKLSDLVKYRNILSQQVADRSYRVPLGNYMDLLLTSTRQNIKVRMVHEQTLQSRVDQVHQALENLDHELVQVLANIEQFISELEPEYFRRSYIWYEESVDHESVEYVLNRRLTVPEDNMLKLKHRVKNLADWKYPSVCIRPGLEDHVHWLVPAHPLYLVDTDRALLHPAISRFNNKYQQHLRPYVIKESQNSPLHFLPDNQFGLIYAYYFFNFRPFEVIKIYFSEIFKKLKPGGNFVFTFNNCDEADGVILAENVFCCYTPAGLLLKLVESLGFEHVETVNAGGGLFWMQIKRPGELTTLRGGQTLAKILSKHVEKSK